MAEHPGCPDWGELLASALVVVAAGEQAPVVVQGPALATVRVVDQEQAPALAVAVTAECPEQGRDWGPVWAGEPE